MKSIIYTAILFCFVNFSYAQKIKVITYNLRYDNAGDNQNQWKYRTGKVDSLFKKYSPDILGIQEGLNNQVNDVQQMLPDFFHVGVGRDDGKTKGEFSAIFFRKEKFDLIESNTFWLSPTPSIIASKGWDAAITRICTYAKVKYKKNDTEFFVFNTHFDHIGETARQESAKLILQKINEIANGFPIIVCGDFNSEPNSGGYQTIIHSNQPKLFDTYSNKQDSCTFTGFAVNGNICKRIDFIFRNENFTTTNFQIIGDNNGKFYPSDHKPVMAILKLKKSAKQ